MHVREHVLRAVVIVALAGRAFAEQPVELAQLPPAVRQAVREQTAGATIVGIVRERARDKVVYEVETTIDGYTRHLELSATGTVIKVEEEVALATVPAEVRAALTARGRVIKVEVVTAGTTVTYEGRVEGKGKKAEVVVDAHGRPPRRK